MQESTDARPLPIDPTLTAHKTDMGTPILPTSIDTPAPPQWEVNLTLRNSGIKQKIEQISGPGNESNCIAHVFLGPHTKGHLDDNDAKRIISENGYTKVEDLNNLKAGDIAIFYQNPGITTQTGGVTHDARADFNENSTILHAAVVHEGGSYASAKFESRLGLMGVYRHRLGDVPKSYKKNALVIIIRTDRQAGNYIKTHDEA